MQKKRHRKCSVMNTKEEKKRITTTTETPHKHSLVLRRNERWKWRRVEWNEAIIIDENLFQFKRFSKGRYFVRLFEINVTCSASNVQRGENALDLSKRNTMSFFFVQVGHSNKHKCTEHHKREKNNTHTQPTPYLRLKFKCPIQSKEANKQLSLLLCTCHSLEQNDSAECWCLCFFPAFLCSLTVFVAFNVLFAIVNGERGGEGRREVQEKSYILN